jgi:hypothetical protein
LRRQVLPGTSPFIVPPAAAKSAFYNNPLSRELWRSAARALHESTHVAVIGYSIPMTDLVTSGFLADTLANNHAAVTVVNPEPDGVRKRREELGDAGRITCIGGRERVATYVRTLEMNFSPALALGTYDDLALTVGHWNRGFTITHLDGVDGDGTAHVRLGSPWKAPTSHSVTLADLHAVGTTPVRVEVRYPSGESAMIVMTAEGRGPSGAVERLRLVPTAAPPADRGVAGGSRTRYDAPSDHSYACADRGMSRLGNGSERALPERSALPILVARSCPRRRDDVGSLPARPEPVGAVSSVEAQRRRASVTPSATGSRQQAAGSGQRAAGRA